MGEVESGGDKAALDRVVHLTVKVDCQLGAHDDGGAEVGGGGRGGGEERVAERREGRLDGGDEGLGGQARLLEEKGVGLVLGDEIGEAPPPVGPPRPRA